MCVRAVAATEGHPARPANCQRDNSAERITSASRDGLRGEGRLPSCHRTSAERLSRVTAALQAAASLSVNVRALHHYHKVDFWCDTAAHNTQGGRGVYTSHGSNTNISEKEGKSLTAKQSRRTVFDQCGTAGFLSTDKSDHSKIITT